jgi:riboflavin synthase
MFSGIVQQKGRIERVERNDGSGRIYVLTPPWEPPLSVGESIGVEGVCLTLVESHNNILRFDLLNETFERTSLGEKAQGSPVNLERALKVGDALGGHFVTGHVDGVGWVVSFEPKGNDWILKVGCPEKLLRDMVPKGSVACDGISLTIVDLLPDAFTVHIIPHTYDVTSISALKPGSAVNIETDMIGKFVRRIVEEHLQRPAAT